MATAVVVLGGSVGPQTVPADAYSAEVVVAADGGLDVANALGIDVDRVVGDLDSVSPGALDAALAAGMPIERHAVDKDETDFELAVQSALRDPVDRLVVLGGAGGRIDHLLGNMAVLCGISGSETDVSVEAWVGDTLVIPLTGRWQRSFPSDTLVSLLAWGGPAVVTAEDQRRQPHLFSDTEASAVDFEIAVSHHFVCCCLVCRE